MGVEYFDVEKGKLAVEISGDGPLVVCAPAMGDLRDSYAKLTSQLVASGFTVACMDVRGHGDSSIGFMRYGDEATATDYLLLIEALGKGPAVLVGASFSAGAATMAAGRRPDLVRGLILLAPFLRNPMGQAGLYLVSGLVSRPWGTYFWSYYSKTLWPGLGKEGAAQRAAEVMKSLKRPGRWSAFQATVLGADHSTCAPWLEKAGVQPALVIMGEKDPDWPKPVEEAQWVASNFKNAKLVTITEVGHAPHFESPEIVGKAVLEFLAGF